MTQRLIGRGGILDSVAARGAGLVVLVLVAYLPAFGGGWLWDDDILITANPLVTEARGLWGIWFYNTSPDYFPVTLTSYWIEYRLWADWAPGYHAVNIVWHAANTVLVWRILVRLGVPGAWLAAAVWGIHPVTVASVAWVAERKNTLSMFFGCLSVLGWMSYEDTEERRFYGWSLLSFVVALLAKTSLVTLPLILPVLSWWRRGRVTRVDLVRTVPFLLASFILGLVTLWYQMSHSAGASSGPLAAVLASLPRGGVLAGRAVGFYLWKDLWPTQLAMVYGVWPLETSRPRAYLPTLVVAALVAGLWWQRKEPWARAGLFAATVFLLALLPILGFLPATYMKSHASVADHWQYVALVAPVALAVALGVKGGGRWLPGGAGRAAAAVIILGILTFRHTAIHRTSKALWTQNLAVADVWDAHLGLSRALASEGENVAAIAEAKRALELYPAATPAWIDLGMNFTAVKRYDEAIAAYQVAIDQGGGDDLFQAAGLAAALGGDLARAEAFFARGAAKRPRDVSVRGDWGLALEKLGRHREALARYRDALAIDPNDPAALNALAYLLASRPGQTGDGDAVADAAEAVDLARRACTATDDGDPSFLDTLATALAAGGEYAAAVEVADRALALAVEGKDEPLAAEIRGHRELFRAGKPYRPE
ncbi:MAG: tetratricopeptide repeat protein [Planctomycetaceae bacterium]|nr:tetratricopeptide repeat protein [Planctomycetaceae bacterium]